MATIQELEAALINADRAGDSTAARILADEIRVARRQAALNLPEASRTRTIIDRPEPGPMARVGRGMMDVADTVRTWTAGAPRAAEIQRGTDAEIARYNEDRGPNAGIDLLRIGGTTAATLPVTAAMASVAPAAALTTLGGRMALGAAQGGTQGALEWTPEGQSKAKQIGMGMAAGTLAPPLADAVGSVVSRLTQFGKAQASKLAAKPEKIVAELEPVLAQQGIRWGDLSEDVRNGMLAQAKRQLVVGGDLAPAALARKVEMDEFLGPGAGPLQGQVTRDPKQWTWERNAQKLPGDIGEPITTRFQAQMQRLQEIAREAIARTGGQARNDFQAGTSATEAVKQQMAESKKVVDDLYAAFRSTGAGNVEVKAAPIADRLGTVMDEYGIENIPSPVVNRLKEFGMLDGEQKKLFTVAEAEKLRRLIGNNMPGKGTPADGALRILRDSVDEAVIGTDAPGVPALKTARDAAAQRFAMRDSALGVTAAAKDEAPDRFFQRYVLNGNIRDIQGLKATLTTGFQGREAPEAGLQSWKDLKGRAIEHAVEKASAKEGTFSGPLFRKALKEMGEERLKVLFEPDELAQLMKLERVAHNLTAEPAFAAVNHSNTAAAGAQYLGDAARMVPRIAEMATNIPFLGKIGAGAWSAGDDMARNAEMKRRVGTALMGDAIDPTMAEDKRRLLAKLLAGRIDPYAATAGAAGATYFSK